MGTKTRVRHRNRRAPGETVTGGRPEDLGIIEQNKNFVQFGESNGRYPD
jgi:hypothetical protein